jgi:hypothetical protein
VIHASHRSRKNGPTPRRPTPRTIDGIPGTVEHGYRERAIEEVEFGRGFREVFWRSVGRDPSEFEMRHYTMGPCNILVGREPAGVDGELLWHLTISTPSRHPTWDEIKTARYRLLPADLTFGMLLPPAAQYVNVEAQDHVFQLWEVRDSREPWSGS